jgi:hypothetical protein
MLIKVFHSIDQKMRLTKGLETSSSITVPFTAEKPRNLQHYMDRGESLKSCLYLDPIGRMQQTSGEN